MSRPWIVLDVASAPIPEAGSYLEPVSAPRNYVDPVKIADYIASKTAERQAMVATDIDLARVTCVGITDGDPWTVSLCRTEDDERATLEYLAGLIRPRNDGGDPGYVTAPTIITFGGHRFDLPLLMRRARYLGVDFPALNLDRYRSPHVDLCELLSDRDPSRRRSLSFYVRRLQMTDLLDKPLSGEDEAKVFETGQWDELAASVRRDVTATARLAKWAGIIP